MGGRGKAARNAGNSGRHEITDSTPRIPLIGPDIEAWAGDREAQIMSTKSAREEAFLDTPRGGRPDVQGSFMEAIRACAP